MECGRWHIVKQFSLDVLIKNLRLDKADLTFKPNERQQLNVPNETNDRNDRNGTFGTIYSGKPNAC